MRREKGARLRLHVLGRRLVVFEPVAEIADAQAQLHDIEGVMGSLGTRSERSVHHRAGRVRPFHGTSHARHLRKKTRDLACAEHHRELARLVRVGKMLRHPLAAERHPVEKAQCEPRGSVAQAARDHRIIPCSSAPSVI